MVELLTSDSNSCWSGCFMSSSGASGQWLFGMLGYHNHTLSCQYSDGCCIVGQSQNVWKPRVSRIRYLVLLVNLVACEECLCYTHDELDAIPYNRYMFNQIRNFRALQHRPMIPNAWSASDVASTLLLLTPGHPHCVCCCSFCTLLSSKCWVSCLK